MEKLTYSVAEAAQALGVSTKTVRALLNAGRLPGIRVGTNGGPQGQWLIPVDGLQDFINGKVA